MGNSSSPPNAYVNASGGVPMKMSSLVGRRMWRGKQSAQARMSRCVCIVPLPRPVLPEVKAMMAMSSAAVSQFTNVADLPCMSDSRASVAFELKWITRVFFRGDPSSWLRNACWHSVAFRVSQSASVICALSAIAISSRQRSSGAVFTATPPALMTANQQATSRGEFGARNSTRFPGTTSRSSIRTCAI
jgi:hypothetical protein